MSCEDVKLAIAKRLVEGDINVYMSQGYFNIELYFKKMTCIFAVEQVEDKTLQLEIVDSTILKYLNGRLYK